MTCEDSMKVPVLYFLLINEIKESKTRMKMENIISRLESADEKRM